MAEEALEKVSIAWHPAFCSAAEFDLRSDRKNLSFDSEHDLSREPLKIDLLIIKKSKNAKSDNDIAKIFRMYNVIEYKSPGDNLNIDDYYKTVGYACIYKGTAHTVNEIPAEELTVSLFREGYPELLIKQLKESGAVVEKIAPGVYFMKNLKPFPTQIVVTKELDPETHAALRILSRHASEEDINRFIEQAKEENSQGGLLNVKAIIEVSYNANQQTYENMKRRDPAMSEALKIFMKDEIEAAVTEKDIQNAKNLQAMGMDVPMIAKALGVTEAVVKKWLEVSAA